MALQMKVTTAGGLEAAGAYIRFAGRFTIDRDEDGNWFVWVPVQVFKDKAMRDANGVQLRVPSLREGLRFTYPAAPAGNIIAWAYKEARKLPEFAEAVEV